MTQPLQPPDKDTEIAILRMRVQAAEAALYAIETNFRNTLETFVQPIVRQMHSINDRFPLGDSSISGVQRIAIDAIRASMPEHVDKTDEQLAALFFKDAR